MKNKEEEINEVIVYGIFCTIKDNYGNYYTNNTYEETNHRIFDNGTVIYNSSEERIALSLGVTYDFITDTELEIVQRFWFSPLHYDFSYEFQVEEMFVITSIGMILPERNASIIPIDFSGYAINYEIGEIMYAFQDKVFNLVIPQFEGLNVILR